MRRAVETCLTIFIVLFLLTIWTFSISAQEEKGIYQNGSIIQFGTYPRKQVTDEEWKSELDGIDKDWKSFDYYSGTGNEYDGRMRAGSFMQFADFFYEGVRYRAVKFDSYRPRRTEEIRSEENSNQDENAYFIDEIYYFIFEAIPWRILDVDTGLVMAEDIVDSQPFQNLIFLNGREYYSGMVSPYFANDYLNSSIREWLNDDFYNTAFTKAQKENIVGVSISNNTDYNDNPQSDFSSTTDKVFLLSYSDVTNTDYGFAENPATYNQSGSDYSHRCAVGTDYAKCQGLYFYNKNKFDYGKYPHSVWWLRSGSSNSSRAVTVGVDGAVVPTDYVTSTTTIGIRPACCLATLESNITNHDHDCVASAEPPTCLESGYTTYSCKYCSFAYIETIDPLGHDYINHDAQEPTCTEIGWDAYQTCSRCDYTSYEEKAALGHDYINHDAQTPTCTKIGWDAYETCSRCDYTTYTEKDALGHSPSSAVIENEIKADCGKNGSYDEVVYCETCKQELSRNMVTTDALDHTDDNNDGHCDRCGEQMIGGDHCKYCGQIHGGAFGWLVKFFHSILAIFKR